MKLTPPKHPIRTKFKNIDEFEFQIQLGYVGHIMRSIEGGFTPVPYGRFRAIAIIHGDWA